MKKSQLIMEMIGSDLDRYEAGERDGFFFLKYAEDVGMVAPCNWIDDCPEWADKWNKFMEGQSVSYAGFYVRDVKRFLCLQDLSN